MRKLLVSGLVLAGLLAAGAVGAAIATRWLTADTGPEPIRYTVVRGDTLFLIARAHGVTVEQLRAWNGLEGDLIEVGQVLIIRTDAATPAAPPPKKKRRAKRTTGGTVHATEPVGDAGLTMPPEHACLAGPTDVAADEGMAASVGLSEDQVRAAMDAFVGRTLRCVPDGFASDGTIAAEITVACTGRVAAVDVTDDGGMPADMVACVRDTLRYTPFPAHDMPDGYTFGYPLRFRF